MTKKIKRTIWIPVFFLILMVMCTILSRVAASMLVAQVSVEKPGKGKLSFTYGGSGTVVPGQENVIFLWPGQQVEWAAEVGSTVKAGECLIQFRMEYLQQAIRSKQAELTQLEIQAQQQEISARGTARVKSAERALQALNEARNRLQEAQQKEAQAQEAYDRLSGSGFSENPAYSSTGGEFAENSADSSADGKFTENSVYSSADKESTSCGSTGSTFTDRPGTPSCENTADRSETNPEERFQDSTPDVSQSNLDNASNESDVRQQEAVSSLQQSQTDAEAARQTLIQAQADVEAARQTLIQAQTDYDFALKEDAASDSNEANAVRSAQLGVRSLQVQVDLARQALDQLIAYQNAGGRICAEQDCTVLTSGVTAGAFTTGSEVLVTGSGGWKLKGIADAKDKEKLKDGMEAEIRLGAGKKRTVRIESVAAEQSAGSGTGESGSSSSELQFCWYTRLPENTTAENGNTFTWTVNASSDQEYEQTIPLAALREDTSGSFCLILSEEKTMLGTVQTAKRVPVTVLEKDAHKAAVTSALKDTDQVIASSEKYVKEGDRVRIRG